MGSPPSCTYVASSIGDIGCRLLSPQQQYRLQPHFPMQLTLLSTDKTRLVETCPPHSKPC